MFRAKHFEAIKEIICRDDYAGSNEITDAAKIGVQGNSSNADEGRAVPAAPSCFL